MTKITLSARKRIEGRPAWADKYLNDNPKDIWAWIYENDLKGAFLRVAATTAWPLMKLNAWTYFSNKIKNKIRTRIRAQVADHIIQNFDIMSLLPFTIDELCEHLDAQMTNDLGWHNPEAWHIDHIIPKSSFKFKSFDDPLFKKCWDLSNLRVCCKTENLKKRIKA